MTVATRPRRTSITILTTFRVIGSTLDGRRVSSEGVVFPVEVVMDAWSISTGLLEGVTVGCFALHSLL